MKKIINCNNIGEYTQSVKKEYLNHEYENMKSVYEEYIKEISKTDFSNSATRYLVEKNMLETMKDLIKKYNISSELDYINGKMDKLKENLEKFGL